VSRLIVLAVVVARAGAAGADERGSGSLVAIGSGPAPSLSGGLGERLRPRVVVELADGVAAP
jgi:hypothetical protein